MAGDRRLSAARDADRRPAARLHSLPPDPRPRRPHRPPLEDSPKEMPAMASAQKSFAAQAGATPGEAGPADSEGRRVEDPTSPLSSTPPTAPASPITGPVSPSTALRSRNIGPTSPRRSDHDMSMRRTGMSFQRTRMSAERTLMSVIRTSLSLIGFGFTIFQFFQKLREAGTLDPRRRAAQFRHRAGAARHRHADRRHRLPHAVHARAPPRAPRDDGRTG